MFTPLLTFLRTTEYLHEPPEIQALLARSRAAQNSQKTAQQAQKTVQQAQKAAKKAAKKRAKEQRNACLRSGVLRQGGLEGAVRYEEHLPAYERVESRRGTRTSSAGRGERVRGSMDAVFEFEVGGMGEGLPGYEEEGLPAYEEVWRR